MNEFCEHFMVFMWSFCVVWDGNLIADVTLDLTIVHYGHGTMNLEAKSFTIVPYGFLTIALYRF